MIEKKGYGFLLVKKALGILLFSIFFFFPFVLFSQVLPASEMNTKRMKGYFTNNYLKRDYNKLGGVLSNDLGIVKLREKLSNSVDSLEEIYVSTELADQLMKSDSEKTAIEMIKKVLQKIQKTHSIELAELEYRLNKMLAMAYMGMVKDIIKTENQDEIFSLFQKNKPDLKIDSLIHLARNMYMQMLVRDSTDLQNRWLLNICCHLVGEYPDSVPVQYKVPFDAFNNQIETVSFVDISKELHLNIDGLAGSPAMEDFDRDGDLDLFIATQSMTSSCKYMVNNGDGTFSDHSQEAGLDGLIGGRFLAHADYNNDGFPDIFIARGAWNSQTNNFPPNSLLRNNGDGTFTDVTIEAGLLRFYPTSSISWSDLNNDGWLDIFIGNETMDTSFPNPCQLYLNNGNGTFSETAKKSGLDITGFIKGAVSADYNKDGWQDIFVSDLSGFNHLFKNLGKNAENEIQFQDVAREAGVLLPYYSQGAFFFDFDNDGWLDIFVPAYSYMADNMALSIPAGYLGGRPLSAGSFTKLYKNKGDGTFLDVSASQNLNRIMYSNACNFGDIDNDGFLDIYLGTGDLQLSSLFPNILLKNQSGKGFVDVTAVTGTGSLSKGQGIAFGDMDNDGDNDIFEVMGGGYIGDTNESILYQNQGSKNNWIQIELVGKKSNKSAIGAQIKVVVTEAKGEKVYYSSIQADGTTGSSPLRKLIGIGPSLKINYVEVFWPLSHIKKRYKHLAENQFYRIEEGGFKAKRILNAKINLTVK